jgi:phospholipid transport system substrate-binding protein
VKRFALAVLIGGLAGTAESGPLVEVLKARQARVDAVLAGNTGELPPAEKKKLEEALTGALDFAEMAEAALGEDWPKRSPAEQKEFAHAFEELLRASLLRRTNIYRVSSITYEAETVEAASGTVHTTVRLKEATTEVGYTFRKSGAAWRIVDYSVDGVSTVRNYRSQFAKILKKNGFPAVLARVRKRTAEIQAES